MLAAISGLLMVGLNIAFWAWVLRLVALRMVRRESQKNLDAVQHMESSLMYKLAQKDAEIERLARENAAAAERRAEAALVAALPIPGIPRTGSLSIDLEAIETAAYGIVMQAHDEGWIENSDFADRAAREATRSQRPDVPLSRSLSRRRN